jgi:transcriptional regulator NrdR family protein
MKTQQEIEKEFNKMISHHLYVMADYSISSKKIDNDILKTTSEEICNDLKFFIRQVRQDDIKSFIELLEKEKSDNPAYICYAEVNRVLDNIQSQLLKELN